MVYYACSRWYQSGEEKICRRMKLLLLTCSCAALWSSTDSGCGPSGSSSPRGGGGAAATAGGGSTR